MSLWFVSVVPKYLNFAPFTNGSLAILIFWFCPEFWWRDVIIYFVFSAFISCLNLWCPGFSLAEVLILPVIFSHALFMSMLLMMMMRMGNNNPNSTRGLLVLTACSNAIGYHRFGGPSCLHFHPSPSIFRVKMEAARSPEPLVSYRISTQCHNPEEPDSYLHRFENLKSGFIIWNSIPEMLENSDTRDGSVDN
jgi:hypothetical protein